MKTLPLLLCGILLAATGCATMSQDPNVGRVSSAAPSTIQPGRTVLAVRDSDTRLR